MRRMITVLMALSLTAFGLGCGGSDDDGGNGGGGGGGGGGNYGSCNECCKDKSGFNGGACRQFTGCLCQGPTSTSNQECPEKLCN